MESMGNEKILWRRELYFFLYAIPSYLNCPSIFEIRKKKGNSSKLHRYNWWSGPWKARSHNILILIWNIETGLASQRSRMNWTGMGSTDFNVCFPDRKLGLRLGGRELEKAGINVIFHPLLISTSVPFPSPHTPPQQFLIN